MHLQYISSHSTRIHSLVSQIAVLSVSLQNSLKVCVYLKQSSQAVDLILLTVPSRLLMQFDAVCIPRTLRSVLKLPTEEAKPFVWRPIKYLFCVCVRLSRACHDKNMNRRGGMRK